jgi:hypothetical protein
VIEGGGHHFSIVMAGLVPAIHVFALGTFLKTWMPGTRLVLGPAKPDPSAGHDGVGDASFEPPQSGAPQMDMRARADDRLIPQASPPRRRPWPVVLTIVLVLLLAAGWSAFWFYAAGKAEETITGWLEREARLGRVYDCGSRSIGGFPFRIEVRCAGATAQLRDIQPPLSLRLPEVLIAAQIYQPTLLISEFTGPLELAESGQPAALVGWTLARTSVRGNPQSPERISVVLDNAAIDRRQGATSERLFSSNHVELHARMAAGSIQESPVLDIAVNLVAASAPALHPLAKTPTDLDINTTLRGLKDLAPKPWAARFREIQEAGGRIEVKNARVSQSDWVLVGAGNLGLTPDGRLDGELRVTVAGLDKLLQTLGVEYLSRSGAKAERLKSAIDTLDRLLPGLGSVAREHAGAGAAAGVSLLGEPVQLEGRAAVSLPLRFVDGAAYLGPLQVGQIPALF